MTKGACTCWAACMSMHKYHSLCLSLWAMLCCSDCRYYNVMQRMPARATSMRFWQVGWLLQVQLLSMQAENSRSWKVHWVLKLQRSVILIANAFLSSDIAAGQPEDINHLSWEIQNILYEMTPVCPEFNDQTSKKSCNNFKWYIFLGPWRCGAQRHCEASLCLYVLSRPLIFLPQQLASVLNVYVHPDWLAV